MRKNFTSRRAKRIIDILLLLGIAGLSGTGKHWNSPHCIGASVWILLMIIHIAQNWKFIKAFTKWKIIKKNKITALTILGFIFILSSVLLLSIGFNDSFILYHHIIARLFFLIIILHIINKFKRFISLFKSITE